MTDVPKPPEVAAATNAAALSEQAKMVRDATIEIQAKAYDKASAYTNLILLAGYAGAFTIWNFTRSTMTTKGTATVAILLGISLVTFVFFEIYKMIVTTRRLMKQRSVVAENLQPAQFLQRLADLQKEFEYDTLNCVMPIWVATLTICVVSALGGIAVLFYTFFAILLCLPIWP